MLVAVGAVVLLLAVTAVVIVYVKKKKGGKKTDSPPSGGGVQVPAGGSGWKSAMQTWYASWPPCCKGSPAYDPKASKTECSDYSGCKYQGDFNTGAHMSYEQVKNTRFCSFYDLKQKNQWRGDKNAYWDSNYKNKFIYIRKKGASTAMKIQILDTCNDRDCSGCCSKNAAKGGGYLIDLESFTERAFNGGSKPVDTQIIEWKFA